MRLRYHTNLNENKERHFIQTELLSTLPSVQELKISTLNQTFKNNDILYHKIQSVCVSVCVYVSSLVRSMIPDHAHYGDEAFAGNSVGLGLDQRLRFYF